MSDFESGVNATTGGCDRCRGYDLKWVDQKRLVQQVEDEALSDEPTTKAALKLITSVVDEAEYVTDSLVLEKDPWVREQLAQQLLPAFRAELREFGLAS